MTVRGSGEELGRRIADAIAACCCEFACEYDVEQPVKTGPIAELHRRIHVATGVAIAEHLADVLEACESCECVACERKRASRGRS